MSPEKNPENYTILGMILAPIVTVLGLNLRWTWLLYKKIGECPEKYVTTDTFNHRVDRLEDSVKTEINGLHQHIDKLAERRVKDRGP